MNEYLNTISQEIYKYSRGKVGNYELFLQLIALNIGHYSNQNKIDYKSSRELLEKIYSYVNSIEESITVEKLSIEDVRKEIFRITNSRSANEVFFYDKLRPYAEMILDKEYEEDKVPIRDQMWYYENKYYITKLKSGKLIKLKEVEL